MSTSYQTALISALEWHLDSGVTDLLEEAPIDRTQITAAEALPSGLANENSSAPSLPNKSELQDMRANAAQPGISGQTGVNTQIPQGAQEAKQKALDLIKEVKTLEDLQNAISEFDGLAIKKTATNMVFSDGHPEASIMLVGEAPGADEDREGKPFVGVSGQLLDRMLKWVELDRRDEDSQKSIYISNILNWRPPGNRTPTDSEIDISLPFIEKHIALIKPSLLIFAGGVAAKALLNSDQSISRLRGMWHDYTPSHDMGDNAHDPIPAIATYHPAYLLRTPVQKKSVWQDFLNLKDKIDTL